jgi:hypothetical protein
MGIGSLKVERRLVRIDVCANLLEVFFQPRGEGLSLLLHGVPGGPGDIFLSRPQLNCNEH